MKILTVAYLQGTGGAARQIIKLTNQLAVRGHDVTLCVLAENKSPFAINDNVNIVDLSNEEVGRFKQIKRFKAFRKTVIELKPDIVVNYTLQSAFFSLFIPKRKRGKIIYSERTDPNNYKGIHQHILKYTVKRMDGLVFQSENARDYFPNIKSCMLTVIHNSVNIDQNEYPFSDVRDNRIVNVGRLHHQKNQKLLIKAFAIIANDFPDYILEIYGDGMMKDELSTYITSIGLENRIFLRGAVTDVFARIHKASLFVLSSDYEGIPNALLEAMSLGLPSISTDCRPGGARTLIKDGINGYIVPTGNVNKLSAKMAYVLSHKEEANTIAQEARKIAGSHTDKAIFDQWNSFILSLNNSK